MEEKMSVLHKTLFPKSRITIILKNRYRSL